MKKTILTTIVLFFTTIAVHSQVTKGNWILGGDIILRGYKFDYSEKYTYYAEVFPKIGYFLADKVALGGEIGFYKAENSGLYSSLVPFCRYYLLDTDKILNPFLEAGIGLKYHNYKYSNYDFAELMYYAKTGISVFFTNSAALNITLNYKRNSFQFHKEISLAFGAQLNLEKKH